MSEIAKKLPHGFPHRLGQVPGWAGIFEIPRYITRVDVDELGLAGTHGWQVRYVKPSTFFSDAIDGKRASPRQSLARAKRYLAAIYNGPKVQIRTTPTKRKKNPIQEAGIRLVERKMAHKTVKDIYVEAVPPSHSIAPKRVYVGTERTATPERLEAAILVARAIRADMVKKHLESRKEL